MTRGVIEVKAPAEEVDDTATSAQIAKYWARYKLVLVTNLRDWLLIGERDGKRVHLERFLLAKSEKGFISLFEHPAKSQDLLGAQFQDFLARALLHSTPIAEPKDLAWVMASYAREARARVETAGELGAKQVLALKGSLESSLGLSFTDTDGEKFFRSTLVQTLFYGVFAAWVLRHENGSGGKFDWRTAAYDLHVPMISALFEQLSQPSKLKALDLTEVLDWTSDALNRVDKTSFFAKFEAARSVQYFYEPFLQAFDPTLRKQLGVWYTPPEIVRYQVARVDEILRDDLKLPDGLADPNVIVLDPCCGTGAYLVEVLHVLSERLKAQGADAVAAHELKKAATTRLFGFELLPAPFVISHLQIGLLLRHRGAPLEDEERAAVYLTNALTGWEPPKGPKAAVLPFPEFTVERDAADLVKQTQKILVIIGNPPYNAFAGVAIGEEQGLVSTYKAGLIKLWGIRKFNLDDLYVRFIRLAERRIAEQGHIGVVCYITNSSYVSDPSYVVMRQHLLGNFDDIWVDNLNGDSRETGKLTPEGLPDPSVFSTEYNREGIKKGTAIAVLVKRDLKCSSSTVRYREWWGATKRTDLVLSLAESGRVGKYKSISPEAKTKFSFLPGAVGVEYETWPLLPDLAAHQPFPGLEECRAGALFDIDRAALESRLQLYFDSSKSLDEIRESLPGLARKAARFEPAIARAKILPAEGFQSGNIQRFAVRPFDIRYCYYSTVRPLWNRPRPALKEQLAQNRFIVSRLNCAASPEGFPVAIASVLIDKQMTSRNPGAIPIRLHQVKGGVDLFGLTTANLSVKARAYLSSLGLPDPDGSLPMGEALWMHALAIAYSPAYISQNADGLRQGWPRIPLPVSPDALFASADLGRQVADLLDTERDVVGVTTGATRHDLVGVAVITRVGGGTLKSEEFSVTAGWG